MAYITRDQSTNGIGNSNSALRVTSPDISISIEGTFGPQALVYIEHSHDGVTWVKTGYSYKTTGLRKIKIPGSDGWIRSQLVRADENTSVTVHTLNSIPSIKSAIHKYGRNQDIDTGSVPEDVIYGGGTYTGLDPTQNENIEVFSSSVNDVGTLVSSGTATGGSHTTIDNDGATFVTDGVTAGDLLLNDSKGKWGTISSVTETQITIYYLDDIEDSVITESGDSYRVVTPGSTGASVIELSALLNEDFVEQTKKFVILNGTSSVIASGDYMRCARGRALGASENAGDITARQETTTANEFFIMPAGTCSTFVAAWTVPAGKVATLRQFITTLTRANGSAGSAVASLRWRKRGGAFFSRTFDITTSFPIDWIPRDTEVSYGEMTDIKVTIDDVSDSNSIVSAEIDLAIEDK